MTEPRGGFTLLELVVVVVVLGLGVALVAPALGPPDDDDATSLETAIDHAQRVAARRGETMLLAADAGGGWTLRGESSAAEGTIASGVLDDEAARAPFALRVSPFGSCGPPVGQEPVLERLGLEPLTCELRR